MAWRPFRTFFWNSSLRPVPNSECFSEKLTPHGLSGQSALWKMIPYSSSLYEVFITKYRKHRYLQCKLTFVVEPLFARLGRLRPASLLKGVFPRPCWKMLFPNGCRIIQICPKVVPKLYQSGKKNAPKWNDGTMDKFSNGNMEQWHNGKMAQGKNGTMTQWKNCNFQKCV